MTLLEECLEVLGENAYVLSKENSSKINDIFHHSFNLTFYGRIDWEKVENKRMVFEQDLIKENNEWFYIIWDEMNLPIIKCRLHNILKYIDDVTAVSFDTWLLSEDGDKIIEFYHENEITIGYKVN